MHNTSFMGKHQVEIVVQEKNVRLTRTNLLQTSNHFSMSTGNLGGRQLMYQLTTSHKKNLSNSKKQIDNSLPWSHREEHFLKFHKNHPWFNGNQNASTKRLSPVKDKSKSNNSFARNGKSTMQQAKKKENAKSDNSNPSRLNPMPHFSDGKQLEVYQEFVQLLCELGTDASHFIANAACIDAEENFLLQDYCGIEPFFDDMIPMLEIESDDSLNEESPTSEAQGDEEESFDHRFSPISAHVSRMMEDEKKSEKKVLEYSSAAVTEMMFAGAGEQPQ